MKTKIIFLIFIILGILEVFFDFFSVYINEVLLHNQKSEKMNEKKKTGIKLFFIIVFFIGLIYFLAQFVQIMAKWFGISLDKGFLDIFK